MDLHEYVVGGCYDGSIHGWQVGGDDAVNFELKFAYKSHLSCVKSVATSRSGEWLASGGTDEIVRIYSLKRLCEVSELIEHTDTVLSLEFIGDKFFLSGGNDGQLCLWRCKDWNCVAKLKGHKPGPVTSIAVHPTGTLALTTSNDNSLRMWDLEAARPASRHRVDEAKSLGLACWSPSGTRYALCVDERSVFVYSVKDMSGKPYKTFEIKARVNGLLFSSDDELCAGLEIGSVRILDASEKAAAVESDSSNSLDCGARVRSLSMIRPSLIAVGLSSGVIQIWDLKEKSKQNDLRLGAGAHLTCISHSGDKKIHPGGKISTKHDSLVEKHDSKPSKDAKASKAKESLRDPRPPSPLPRAKPSTATTAHTKPASTPPAPKPTPGKERPEKQKSKPESHKKPVKTSPIAALPARKKRAAEPSPAPSKRRK